jgi:hypothetical protein
VLEPNEVAVLFHEILGDPANSDRPVVFYSKTDARSRANAAIVQKCVIDSEVHRRAALAWSGGLRTCPLAWGFGSKVGTMFFDDLNVFHPAMKAKANYHIDRLYLAS